MGNVKRIYVEKKIPLLLRQESWKKILRVTLVFPV